jgi:hypothetical protein
VVFEKIFKSLSFFVIISLSNLFFYPMMICTKLDWNWIIGSKVKDFRNSEYFTLTTCMISLWRMFPLHLNKLVIPYIHNIWMFCVQYIWLILGEWDLAQTLIKINWQLTTWHYLTVKVREVCM